MKKEKQPNHHTKYHHKKYSKPYRKRHFVGLVFFSVLTVISLVFLGVSFSNKILVIDNNGSEIVEEKRLDKVISSQGFSFDIPADTYKVLANENANSPLLAKSSPYSGSFAKVQLKTGGITSGSDAVLAKLTVEKRPKQDYQKALSLSKSEEEALQKMADFSVSGFDTNNINKGTTKLNNQDFYFYEYALSPNQKGNKIYVKKWLKKTDDGVYVITADNLLNISQAEEIFALPLKTIQIGEAPKYEKLSGSIFSKTTTKPKKEITADEISPSVVKIYHFVCGELVLNGQKITADTCDGNVGSGFFVGSDGQIATNGHVVTLTPADFLINIISNNPENTRALLKFMGVSDAQIASQDSDKLALSLMSALYNLSEERLRIENYRELTVIATSSEALKFASVADVKKLIDFQDSKNLAKAKILARDYSAKDIANLNNQNGTGFSANDTAILKINVTNSPYIAMADTDKVEVNDKITVLGFPSDAENQLTDNSIISPTVTTGTISAKRIASGSSSRLFQSDADASQGNSGGPAIDQFGNALGILTYRYKDDTTSNAAKSYIRDVKDVVQLAKDNNINIGGVNKTYEAWQKGLEYYKDSHYSESLKQFALVQDMFPAHRLVDNYALNASQAIREGKDRPLINQDMVFFVAISIFGLIGTTILAVVIHKHRLGHHIHKDLKQRS